MNSNSTQSSFRVLDGNIQIHSVCALDEWYVSVRDTPIGSMAAGDLARAVRQKQFLEYVVPESLSRLSSEPMVGDYFDGELLVSLKEVPKTFWHSHPDLRELLVAIIAKLDATLLDQDTIRDLSAIRTNIMA